MFAANSEKCALASLSISAGIGPPSAPESDEKLRSPFLAVPRTGSGGNLGEKPWKTTGLYHGIKWFIMGYHGIYIYNII